MPRQREFDKEAVLDRAVLMFWARGYEATSVRDLTGAMGISSSSLYEVFGDKHAVFMLALKRYCAQEQARTREIADTAAGPTDFVERLFASLDSAVVQEPYTQGSMAFNAMVEFGARDAAVSGQLLAHYEQVAQIVTDALTRWQQAETITRAVPASELAHMLLSTLLGVVTISAVARENSHRDAITRLMIRMFSPSL